MDILLYEWNSVGQKDLEDCLATMGHKVDKLYYIFSDFEKDEVFENKMEELLLNKKYDLVISFNYFQVISKVCNYFHLKYVAWVWDSPLINMFTKSVYNPCNYIFIFDRELYKNLKKLNVNTIYYLSLGVHVDRLDKLEVTEVEKLEYANDVSFVGSLYENKNQFDYITNLPEYLKGYFDGIMRAQMKIYGYNFIEEMLTQDIMEELLQYITIKMGDQHIGQVKGVFAELFINSKITEIERKKLLKTLADYFDVTIYTASNTEDIPRLHKKGFVDYYDVMPKVFRNSKINLNITLRTIKSGIPLRVLDVLGAGGFLITNYQSEIPEYFEVDKDLVCFHDEEDMINKVRYYLEHEDERKQIAYNGYQKVKKYHNYITKLETIFDVVFSGKKADHREVSEAIILVNNKNTDSAIKDSKDKENIVDNNCDNLSNDNLLHDNLMQCSLSHDKISLEGLSLQIEKLEQELSHLVQNGWITEARQKYYNVLRYQPFLVKTQLLNDLEIMFDIYNYESKLIGSTMFSYSTSLNIIWEHFDKLKAVVVNLEKDMADYVDEFTNYLLYNKVSYVAVTHIILYCASDAIKMLNDIAMMFYEMGRDDMIIPYLSKAIDLNEKDYTTLYNLSLVLYSMKEYHMAQEYIMKMDSMDEKSTELFNLINENMIVNE